MKAKSSSTKKLNETATWKVEPSVKIEYKSERHHEFSDPKTKPSVIVKLSGEHLAKERDKMRDKAVEKFEKIAKKRYGSIEGLFSAFKKDPESSITLEEFSEHLRKRNMDLYFPRDDQRLLFEKMNPSNSNVADVKAIIAQGKNDESIQSQLSLKTLHLEFQDLVLSKIEDQRIRDKLVVSPRQTRTQLYRALRNLDPDSTGYLQKDQVKWAIGPKYLNLNLTPEELDAAVEMCPLNASGDISYDRFIKHLNIRNSDPVSVPFFDKRADNIAGMNNRLKDLEDQINDPTILARRDDLFRRTAVHSTVNTGSLTPSHSSFPLSPVDPNRQTRTSHSRHHRESLTLSHDNSVNASGRAPIEKSCSSRDPDADLMDSLGLNQASPFRARLNDSSHTYVRFPMTVDIQQAYSGHVESIPGAGGRRKGPPRSLDKTFLHHSCHLQQRSLNESEAFSVTSPNMSPSSDMYKSTSETCFAPLDYQPSKPVTRQGDIGDAMRCALEREEKRRKRYERTAANMKFTQDRLELDKLSQELQERIRSQSRLQESLAYERIAFNRDNATHSRRPGELMQRKPNPQLFQKMWGGTIGQGQVEADDRDFTSTYQTSYLAPSASAPSLSH